MSHLDNLDAKLVKLARDAAGHAAALGARGTTFSDELRAADGTRVAITVTITAVAHSRTSPASLWRITNASDPALDGITFVQAALPGRATSHAAEEVSA
jgi:hypothetical protein